MANSILPTDGTTDWQSENKKLNLCTTLTQYMALQYP